MRRGTRAAVALVVVGAVASPALRDRDSFPLSTYPVYADVRPREATFVRAVGFGATGAEIRLSMSELASTDDPLVADARLRDDIAAGRQDELCVRIAGRSNPTVVAVLVVEERHDVVRAARGEPSLILRKELARCPRPT